MEDHHIASRKSDLERIADTQSAAINVGELFEKTNLVDIFPKAKSVISVKETDSLEEALSVI